ncbi:glucose-1-phosphate thymidylyltransferase [Candidatus Parvarchaeota archaeon]|nr:glucose-1-phosphate thymidylyltransferase [Candidatus Parvarchaeota archaeon]
MAIKKAVILAAGEGKRLRPLTSTRPKCMIHIAGKPILHHVLDSLREAGVSQAVVVVKYLPHTIKDYFNNKDCGVELEFVVQGDKYGTAAAFGCACGKFKEAFYALAGDIITEPSAFKKLSSAHQQEQSKQGGAQITAALKLVQNPQEYGLAKVKGDYIESFAEKPKIPTSNLANCSLYVFEPSVFSLIDKVKPSPRGEYEITDVLKSAKVRACIIDEYWLDMGLPWQLFAANEFLLSKMPAKNLGLVENSTIKGRLILGKNSRVLHSYIEGTVYVGDNCEIGPHAYIRGTTSIGNNCSIGDSTTIKNSIIFDNVNAKHLSYIGDSIVGEGCNFGAATQIANFRFDAGAIKATVNDIIIDTNRNKLGAIIGDKCKFGVLCSIMPGKCVGDGCWIGANVMVEADVPGNTWLSLKQDLVSRQVPKIQTRKTTQKN